jgi:hypothetical protein
MGLGGKSEKCKFPKRHKMQRSFTCGSETMGDRVKQIIPRRVFMSGKVTPEIIKYLSHPKYSEILFSYPPYNQCDELVRYRYHSLSIGASLLVRLRGTFCSPRPRPWLLLCLYLFEYFRVCCAYFCCCCRSHRIPQQRADRCFS